ncbi:MAG: sigma-54 dependent transcriptional regulator [Syntrophales bacterium]|jgi:DNA-binding NtrC family response regulator|nr:sigma-54 dependent transcriptional regulator [Syntrophales bacterium]
MNDGTIKRNLLIIDDDRIFCETVKEEFHGPFFDVHTAYSANDGLRVCRMHNIDVVLLDEKLPDRRGHAICPEILESNEECKILFITAHPSFEHAIQAIRSGAHDYLLKPFELEELRLSIKRALQMSAFERAKLLQSYKAAKDQKNSMLIGTLGQRGRLSEMVRRATEVRSPVLITGDTGTGKTLLARHIHYASPWHDAPFVFINCATLPESLIESELFGYEKGAFTGAETSRKGVFELAEGGTLFLDEISTMPLHLQAKLLGVLDNSSIRRLGGESQVQVDVRIIAATNIDLETAIQNNQFRKDLYYRISVLCIHIPPLRERTEDIPLLCRHFIALFGGNPALDLDDKEIRLLLKYGWPGNVRELRNVLERSFILHKQRLRPSELLFVAEETETDDAAVAADFSDDPIPLEEMERNHIMEALKKKGGNLTQTARALGISLSTLKRKVRRFQSPDTGQID